MTEQGISVENKVLGRVARAFGFISVAKGTVAITRRSGKFNGILGRGLHYAPSCLGYKVTGKLPLNTPLLECGITAKTKDRASIVMEGFVRYQITEKVKFDLAVTTKGLRDAFSFVIPLKVVDMDYVAICKQKRDVEKDLEDFLEGVAGVWGVGDCRVVIVNIEKFDPQKDGDEVEKDLGQKLTPAVEAFKLRAEAKKKGKELKVSGKAKGKEKAKKIQPRDSELGSGFFTNFSKKEMLRSHKSFP